MKEKRILFLLLILAVGVVLSGCGSTSPATQEAEKPLVYCTIYPLYDFTVKIGGDRVRAELMVPAGVEPHEWEPGPQMLAALAGADLIIYNGFDMEPWLDKVAASLGDSVAALNASQGIEPLSGYAGHSHDHDHDHDHDCDLDHDDEDEDDEGYEQAGPPDPHVWLDPLLALHQAEQIAEALAELDPENRLYYEENLASFRKNIEALHQAYRVALYGLEQRVFIVTHQSFSYLAERYGLKQVGIAGLTPHAEPTPAQMRDLIDFARLYAIHHIFREPLGSDRLAEVLAAETGAEILVLNPLEGLTTEQIAAGEDYFSVMLENLEQLKTALQNHGGCCD
jgi:zinc transport system substrate-binding protein